MGIGIEIESFERQSDNIVLSCCGLCSRFVLSSYALCVCFTCIRSIKSAGKKMTFNL
jgi:hypothetical protein